MKHPRDSLDGSTVRNLDEIQEGDPYEQPSRVGALVLSSLGGACIVFAAIALMRSPTPPKVDNTDPLGDLVARTHAAGVEPKKAPTVVGQDVTFPAMLSDAKRPTTALEAVRGTRAAATAAPAAEPSESPAPELPALGDKLPPLPLPAQQVLAGGPPEAAPGDKLTAIAQQVAREEASEMGAAGGPGGYQLQVSSFKAEKDAQGFADALRRRGHKAYVEPAEVRGRGLWYRVRIGPFKYKHDATVYRRKFESKEKIVTFIVDPPKVPAKIHSEQ